MLYEVLLEKEKIYWWDEDKLGDFIFHADNDEQAVAFVATIVLRINRKYLRMNEQRNVFIFSICRIERDGYMVVRESINLSDCSTLLKGFCAIRKALNAFYPIENGKRYWSMAHTFSNYKPVRQHPPPPRLELEPATDEI